MVSDEVDEQGGAGLPRRLLGLAWSAVWIVATLVVGWFLWPSSLGGCTTLTIVSGHSMEPTYHTGDLVVSRCGPVEVGDVVVYNPPDTGDARVIHRIVGGNAEDGWVIQGDNNDFLDPWTPTDERILGSAVLHLPRVGTIAGVLLNPLTWVSVFVIAAAIFIWPGKKTEGEPEGEGGADGAAGDPVRRADPAAPHDATSQAAGPEDQPAAEPTAEPTTDAEPTGSPETVLV